MLSTPMPNSAAVMEVLLLLQGTSPSPVQSHMVPVPLMVSWPPLSRVQVR